MAVSRELTGSCLCRAVSYVVHDDFEYSLICHCSDCRRATGSAFKAFAGISREKVVLTDGSDKVLIFGNIGMNHDVHCGVCGSLLYSMVGRDKAHVTLGSLHEAPSIRPSAHMFVSDKAPWYDICDPLPQYSEHVR